jgi:hypothetical protein
MVQKIVVVLEEPFNQAFLPESDTRREQTIALACSPAMVAAMSIPGYLYQAHFFADTTVRSPEGKLTAFQKLAHAGSYKNEVLDNNWNNSDTLVLKIGFSQWGAGQFGVEAEFRNGEEEVYRYVFIVRPDGDIGLLIG